ncbi:MAG: response regulator transcription factor [Anaerolineales bacterium]|jgi:NarL family two-component system response regulator LiaR|nr:response regulator transcription factor [Anaerolineales bacterium]
MNDALTIRVMFVDDHNVVRSGLATFLKAYDDLELVGEAKNGLEALQLCRQQAPDVILMDLLMPEMDGIAATRAILAEYPEIKIVAMTSFEEEELVQGVLAAGAISYLIKNVTSDELAKAIRDAVSGRSTLSPEAAKVLIQATRPVNKPPSFSLTERERQVLSLVVAGHSNQQIAEALVISITTVKAHISNILSKLQVSSRVEAINYAIKHKLVSI